MKTAITYVPDADGGTVRVVSVGKLSFRSWLNQIKAAVRIMRESVGKPATPRAEWAIWWLKTNGLHSRGDVDAFEARIALLEQPGDPSRIVYCVRCHAPLSDPVSKLYRMGPDCRRSGRGTPHLTPAQRRHVAANELALDAADVREPMERFVDMEVPTGQKTVEGGRVIVWGL